MGEDIELSVARSARELLLHRLEIREKRLILPEPPEGSDAASALARTCVHEAQEAMGVSLPLRRQIKIVTELVDRIERFEGLLMLIRDPFNHGFSVGADRYIHYARSGEPRVSRFQLADEYETAEVVDRVLPQLSAPISRVDVPAEPAVAEPPPLSLSWQVHRGLMSAEAADFLEKCVAARLNIVVSGELGSGRTTTVAALAALSARDERVITVEETPEFDLPLEHVVKLTLPQGGARVTLRDLVQRTWRMRPDRILLGEVRGDELYDLLDSVRCTQACTLTSVSAGSPQDAISRLEQLAQSALPGVDPRDVLELVSGTVDVVVHQERFPDGSRRVTSITELHGMVGDELDVRMIFEYLDGRLAPTGASPSFVRARTTPPPRNTPPQYGFEPEPDGPPLRWMSQVAPRTMNPLRARQLAAAGMVNPKSRTEPPDHADNLKLHLMLADRAPSAPEVVAALNAPGDWRAAAKAKVAVRQVLDALCEGFPAGVSEARRTTLVDAMVHEVLGAGRIQPLLDDPATTAVYINGPTQVVCESNGRRTRTDVTFDSDAQVMALIDRYAPKPVFNEADSLSPTHSAAILLPPWMREGKLPDGTLLTAFLPPASMIGPVVYLKKA